MISTNCVQLFRQNALKSLCYSARPTSSQGKESLPASFVVEESNLPVDPKHFDKSGLLLQHKNLLHNKTPYKKPHSWIHLTEKYQRKQYGRYGARSRVNPQICFNSKQIVQSETELQRSFESETLQSMIEKIQINKNKKLEAIKIREDEISKRLDKLEQWKSDLNAKVAKREADALAAKERKERLIEEVRRHFGFKVDPRDDRFKEMLEQKEKEDKRKQKEAKRKAKEEKMMAKLVEKTSNN